jgi:hypothetical protein
MAGDYQIMVPPNTTDPQLVNILQELLPEILMSRFGWDSMYARTLAEELAPAIVRRATECSQLQLLKDQPNSISVISPSPKHCDDLKKFLDDFVVVRGWPAQRRSTVMKMAAKLWSLISKEDEHWDVPTGSGGGVRA